MSQLQQTQHNPSDTNTVTITACGFYNMHIRKEGQAVLTEEEFARLDMNQIFEKHKNELRKSIEEERDNIKKVDMLLENLKKRYA